jgi:hypothetical protein
MKITKYILILCLGFIFTGCASQAPSVPQGGASTKISFKNDVAPIFASRCSGCHGNQGGLSLASYSDVMKGGVIGVVIVPSDPNNSLLYKYVSTGVMPKSGGQLTKEQVQIIMNWISQGALNN